MGRLLFAAPLCLWAIACLEPPAKRHMRPSASPSFAGRPLDLVQGPDGEVFVTDFFQGTSLRFFKPRR